MANEVCFSLVHTHVCGRRFVLLHHADEDTSAQLKHLKKLAAKQGYFFTNRKTCKRCGEPIVVSEGTTHVLYENEKLVKVAPNG
jgi:hypothetical protein